MAPAKSAGSSAPPRTLPNRNRQNQVIKNLEIAESARAEADALRKATLSLTQDLHMDSVMEALLRSLEELVPYTLARVIVPEEP
jgi:hypothetical protein